MASGSEDYWSTTSRLLATLIEAIKASVSPGGTLISALDGLDGKLDGLLTVSELTDVQAVLLSELLDININLASGSDILNALDSLDGKMDSFITLEDITAVQAELLGKLTGIDTSLLTGSNLLDALDALDGKVDGRLTLAELNTSAVKSNLDIVCTRLNTTISYLSAHLEKLIDVLASNLTQEEYQRAIYPAGWVVVGDSEELLALYDEDRRYCKVHADVNNGYNLDIVEREEDEEYITHHVLLPNDVWQANYLAHKLYAKCLGSGQTVGFLWVTY